jgi:hypothetical protein
LLCLGRGVGGRLARYLLLLGEVVRLGGLAHGTTWLVPAPCLRRARHFLLVDRVAWELRLSHWSWAHLSVALARTEVPRPATW